MMAIFNGCFGGGALLFLLFNFLYFDYQYSLKTLFIAYAVLLNLLLLCGGFLWPWSKFSSYESDENNQANDENNHANEENDVKGSDLVDDSMVINSDTKKKEESNILTWVSNVFGHVITFDFIFLVFYIGILVTKGNFFLSTSTPQLILAFEGPVNSDIVKYALFLLLL